MMMKLKKLSLRIKVTVLTALIITSIAAGMTLLSIFNVDRLFVQNIKDEFAPVSYSIKAVNEVNPDDIASFESTPGVDLQSEMMTTDTPEAGMIAVSLVTKGQESFTFYSYILMAVLILIGVIAVNLLTWKTLKPVKQLSDKIHDMDENNLSERLQNEASSKEIAQLTDSFNHMLDRLDTAFQNQKNFAAAAAHELKTPLACVRANIEVLQMEDSPNIEEMSQTIEVTKRNTDRLIDLVDNLLKLNVTEEEAMEPIPIDHMLCEIISELNPKINEKNLNVTGGCTGIINGNYSLLYRAFYNLVENAVKYNRQDGTIDISSIEENGCLKISIKDNGIGIPAEEIGHVFEPFYRVDKSRSRKIGGSGLGLSIVKNILDRYQAKITVEENLPVGTIFHILFPVTKE